jgi:hypothetical protein
MVHILGIDPHKRWIAWALFYCGELRDAGISKTKAEPFERGLREMFLKVSSDLRELVDVVVVEQPRVYPKSRGKRPNDLIDLSIVAGVCCLLGKDVVLVHPRTWKGQVPKDVTKHRSGERLDRQEKQILIPFEENEHVWDAVGIGQWYLKEMGV